MISYTYSKEAVRIDKLDKELRLAGLEPQGMTFNPPDELFIEFTLALSAEQQLEVQDLVLAHLANTALKAKLVEMNIYRDARMHNGVYYGGYRFDTQADSLVNIAGTATGLNTLMLLAAPLPEEIPWTVSSNDEAPMAVTEFLDFALKVMQWTSQAYTACRHIKDDLISAYLGGDSSALNYDYAADSRWPSNQLGGSIAAPLRLKPFSGA